MRTTLLLLVWALANPPAAHAADLHELGTIPGSDGFASHVHDVSADGQVVVGVAALITYYDWVTVVREQAFRSVGGQMTGFANLLPNHERSIARAASADGSVVTGQYQFYSGATEVFRWENGVLTTLGDAAGGPTFSRGNAITADGSTIGGYGNNAAVQIALTWADGSMETIGSGSTLSLVRAISADGTLLAGTEGGGVVWQGGTATALVAPAGAAGLPVVHGMSADGSVVVGETLFPQGRQAVIWVEGVPEVLGDLPGGLDDSWADDASANGSVVVGTANTSVGRTAFVWDRVHGMRELATVLDEGGVDLTGWRLLEAKGVSDDGLTIVGDGIFILDDLGFRATLDPGAVSAPTPELPVGSVRVSVAPNPFNPRTRISFELAEPGRVRVDLYDGAGRHLRRLEDADVGVGQRVVIWDGLDAGGRPVASGVYLVRVRTATGQAVSKVAVVR